MECPKKIRQRRMEKATKVIGLFLAGTAFVILVNYLCESVEPIAKNVKDAMVQKMVWATNHDKLIWTLQSASGKKYKYRWTTHRGGWHFFLEKG